MVSGTRSVEVSEQLGILGLISDQLGILGLISDCFFVTGSEQIKFVLQVRVPAIASFVRSIAGHDSFLQLQVRSVPIAGHELIIVGHELRIADS